MSDIGKNVCTGIQCDGSNLKDLDRTYALIKNQKGCIDILFANAGVIQFAPLEKITEEHFDKLFDIHVGAVNLSINHLLVMAFDKKIQPVPHMF